MNKLLWVFVLDTKGCGQLYTVNGAPIPHPEKHMICAALPSNPNVGNTCKHKLFHSDTNIIDPFELEKAIKCYNSVPVAVTYITYHGKSVVRNNKQIVKG